MVSLLLDVICVNVCVIPVGLQDQRSILQFVSAVAGTGSWAIIENPTALSADLASVLGEMIAAVHKVLAIGKEAVMVGDYEVHVHRNAAFSITLPISREPLRSLPPALRSSLRVTTITAFDQKWQQQRC